MQVIPENIDEAQTWLDNIMDRANLNINIYFQLMSIILNKTKEDKKFGELYGIVCNRAYDVVDILDEDDLFFHLFEIFKLQLYNMIESINLHELLLNIFKDANNIDNVNAIQLLWEFQLIDLKGILGYVIYYQVDNEILEEIVKFYKSKIEFMYRNENKKKEKKQEIIDLGLWISLQSKNLTAITYFRGEGAKITSSLLQKRQNRLKQILPENVSRHIRINQNTKPLDIIKDTAGDMNIYEARDMLDTFPERSTRFFDPLKQPFYDRVSELSHMQHIMRNMFPRDFSRIHFEPYISELNR